MHWKDPGVISPTTPAVSIDPQQTDPLGHESAVHPTAMTLQGSLHPRLTFAKLSQQVLGASHVEIVPVPLPHVTGLPGWTSMQMDLFPSILTQLPAAPPGQSLSWWHIVAISPQGSAWQAEPMRSCEAVGTPP
jgi:hypothetical protein